jgi:hypothetical protein
VPLTIKIPGKPGSVWTVGSGAPTASANAGDLYFRTDTSDVYQSSGGTTWTVVGNIKGGAGPTQVSATSGPILPWLENGTRRLFIQYANSIATIDSSGDIVLSPNDTQSFRASADGKIYLGPSTDSPAANLYRNSASALQTDATFAAITTLSGKYAGTFSNSDAAGYGVSIATGAAGNYALAASVVGDAYTRFLMNCNGVMSWGSGAANSDTTLYRIAPGTLKTDGAIYAATGLTAAGTGLVSNPQAGAYGLQVQRPSEAYPRFIETEFGTLLLGSGTANPDTNLYRSAANALKTDGALTVGGALTVSGAANSSIVGNLALSNNLTVGGLTTVTGAIAGATNTVPAAGIAGQILTKNSATAYDAAWANPAGQSYIAYQTISASLSPAVAGTFYLVNTTSTSPAITLPTVYTAGSIIGFRNVGTTNNFAQITGNIEGTAGLTEMVPPGYVRQYVADGSTWRFTSDRPAMADPAAPVPISGNWYDNRTSALAALSNLALAANAAYYVPIFLPRRTPISAIGLNVSTAGTGSTIRLGAFTMDPTTGKPAAIVFDAGTVAGTATGAVNVAPTGAILPAGWSFLAVVTTAATTTPSITYCAAGSTAIPFGAGTTQSTSPLPAWTSTTTSGAFAASPTSTLTANLPLIQYKVA